MVKYSVLLNSISKNTHHNLQWTSEPSPWKLDYHQDPQVQILQVCQQQNSPPLQKKQFSLVKCNVRSPCLHLTQGNGCDHTYTIICWAYSTSHKNVNLSIHYAKGHEYEHHPTMCQVPFFISTQGQFPSFITSNICSNEVAFHWINSKTVNKETGLSQFQQIQELHVELFATWQKGIKSVTIS
jgi:hypothetical protein